MQLRALLKDTILVGNSSVFTSPLQSLGFDLSVKDNFSVTDLSWL